MPAGVPEKTSAQAVEKSLLIRYLGLCHYNDTFEAMKVFTDRRSDSTLDEIWLLEHYPVFTQGQAGKSEHIQNPGAIPVVQSDRGGQVTYHGPGQITGYLLLDLRRMKLGVRELVTLIEESLVDTLAHWGIHASSRSDAPGVYTQGGEKIASLGLRVRRGCSYHGFNFNVDMDLGPWHRINPCGLNVPMTQMRDCTRQTIIQGEVAEYLAAMLVNKLGYNSVNVQYRPLVENFSPQRDG
ncbi:MAG: lipoyl(octanoyl) transferase LipB [Porticoccaceae bacterium]|nr:lipoyl(octanoyl) transferase LipB [Pseudomonadales bacterium]MCP5170906.1 lipoyl(octanoyl) transferase LipB [Pseudomonadales bacterium]MCP5301854.1 lipoyl(octanoyl) transferase LipB [Pseudomonadales bacterium]